jgi:hypothetical protein
MPNSIARRLAAALTFVIVCTSVLVFASDTRAQFWQPPSQWQPPWRSQPPRERPSRAAHHRRRETPEGEKNAPSAAAPVSVDQRDSLIATPGAYNGHPYWLALAQCGGIYFKLNTLYTDAAVRARVVKPDPKANAELTAKIKEAIGIATTYFDGAEHFLMNDRGIERTDAVLVYDGPSRAEGDRIKAVEAGLAAAKSCPTLYQACRAAFPKLCGEPLKPAG